MHHWGTRAEPDEPSDHAIPRPRLDSSVPAPFRVLAASGERESIEQLRVSLTIPSVAKGTTRPPANDCVPAEAAPDAMLSGALEAPAVAGLPVASSALAPRPAAPAELPGRVGLTSLRLRWFVLAVVLGVLAGLLLAWAIQLAVS